MSILRDLISQLQEKHDAKETFFASPEDYAFFQQSPRPPNEPRPEKVEKQSVSEKEKFEVKPILPKKTIDTPPYIDSLRGIVAKAAPQLALKETVPDDSMAKKVGALWQDHLQDVHVAVLSMGAQGKELEFLQNVAAAVSSLLAPAQVVDAFKMEREKKWDLFFEKTPLKVVLAPPVSSWKGKALAAHFRENPVSNTATFGPAAAIILRPLREYLQTPSLKRELWKTLVSHLSS